MTLQSVETLFRKRKEEITADICKNSVEHVKQVENFYWKTDRIKDQEMDKLEISLDYSNENESDMETDPETDRDDNDLIVIDSICDLRGLRLINR